MEQVILLSNTTYGMFVFDYNGEKPYVADNAGGYKYINRK